MLKTDVSFFNISSEFAQTFVLSLSKLSECLMQRTMLAAVHATEGWLIAHQYMIQISAHLAFVYTKRELFAL